MRRTDVVVIGGGQAGLAMSRCLSGRGISHVVLERGRVGERWRSERWDSLRLLTPNWQSRLPGFSYSGPDPDGFMTMPEVIGFLEDYAREGGVPVEGGTNVLAVERRADGFSIETDRGAWSARAVVVATGYCDTPAVPAIARGLAPSILQLAPTQYRRPGDLPDGGVLVVGASASGLQLAHELRESGRDVVIAAGHHTRVPRQYRGRDILWWLDRMGIFDETAADVHDVEVSREQPSFQLVGRPDHRTLDLQVLRRDGVRVAGRVRGIEGARVSFEDDLVATTAAADVKLAVLLRRINGFIAAHPDLAVEPRPAFEPLWPRFVDGPHYLDLARERIATVLWCTGFRRHYPWLRVPVLDARGEITHEGGVTPVRGLYVIGLHFLRRRKSSFIDGVGDDARALAGHIAMSLGTVPHGLAAS